MCIVYFYENFLVFGDNSSTELIIIIVLTFTFSRAFYSLLLVES